jgi:hypothetical protein
MDLRKCAVCPKEFDFDVEGLEGPGGVVVCSNACATKSAESRGRKVVVHDHSGAVADTNVKPGDKIGKHHW